MCLSPVDEYLPQDGVAPVEDVYGPAATKLGSATVSRTQESHFVPIEMYDFDGRSLACKLQKLCN